MMKKFKEKKFNIPALKGISAKTIEEHLKLYAGYVKNANELLEKNEYDRRFPFEFDGMRNHEYYFSHLAGGLSSLGDDSRLRRAIEEEWGSFSAWLSHFKTLATIRGIGWAMLYYDPHTKKLLNAWIDEQHLGHLTGLSLILALDMWEHSYVADYQPSGKKQYIEDFFTNLNWQSVEQNYANASKE